MAEKRLSSDLRASAGSCCCGIPPHLVHVVGQIDHITQSRAVRHFCRHISDIRSTVWHHFGWLAPFTSIGASKGTERKLTREERLNAILFALSLPTDCVICYQSTRLIVGCVCMGFFFVGVDGVSLFLVYDFLRGSVRWGKTLSWTLPFICTQWSNDGG